MSARPDVPRLAGEELDLLLSRSLDGDLSPEEEQRLDRLVALDPAAARRRDELAALVEDLKTLPEPAAPFAIATRVNGNVAERAGRPGSLGGRLGFFPPPGFAKAALVVLGIVGAAIALLRPVPKRAVEGPVEVLLFNPQQPAAPAPRTLIAEAKPARTDDEARRQESDELRKEAPAEESEGRANSAESAGKKASAKLERSFENAPPPAEASNARARTAPKTKAELDSGTVLGGAVAQAPAKIVSSAEAAAPAPALASAPAAGAHAERSAFAAPRGWTVSVVGDAARLWSLRRAPDAYPVPESDRKAVFRVRLEASGRVASVRLVSPGVAEPGLDEFVRGMVFEPRPGAEGDLRDAKRKDAPEPATAGAEIEIEVAPR